MTLWRDKQWLKDQFSVVGATVLSVSSAVGCDEKTIRRNMAKHGIRTRPMSENASYRQAWRGNLDPLLDDVLAGEMLGDGCLSEECSYSAIYQHTSSRRRYLEWLQGIFLRGGLPSSVVTNPLMLNGKQFVHWHLSSRAASALLPMRRLWYPNRIKVIPSGLKITPQIALHWYLGDGSLTSHPRLGVRSACNLATCGFHWVQIEEILKPQLRDFRPRLSKIKKVRDPFGYCLVVDAEFLDFIGPCPEALMEIYGYKWAVVPRRRYERHRGASA